MIEKYTKKDGTVAYQFQIYLGIDPVSGKPIRTRRRGFKTKREATIAESQLRAEFDVNIYTNSDVRFEQLCKLWLSDYKKTVRVSTYDTARYIVENTILKTFGKIRVKDITVLFCQKAINDWSECFSDISSHKNYAKMILDFAVCSNVITTNPFRAVRTPRKKQSLTEDSELYYTIDELKTFLSFVENDIYNLTIFRLLAFTGLRKGELLALTWGDIDFKTATLSVNKTASKTRYGMHIDLPKTKRSIRSVSLDDETIMVLKKWKLHQSKKLLEHGFNANKTEQHLFTNYQTNKMLSHSIINKRLNKICDDNNFKKIKIHGFRHTHCSLLFEAGATMQEVQDRLGHENISTTMNIYAHVTRKQRDALANKFAQYIGSW